MNTCRLHRDYASSAQAQIRWYDDELLIMNPGGLPSGLKIEELKRRHESRPRNEKIARMFFYAGGIERWGGGTIKILDECSAAKLPEPRFEEEQGGFWLLKESFRRLERRGKGPIIG